MRKCNGHEWGKVNTFSSVVKIHKRLFLRIFPLLHDGRLNNLGSLFLNGVLIQER